LKITIYLRKHEFEILKDERTIEVKTLSISCTRDTVDSIINESGVNDEAVDGRIKVA